MHLRFFQFLIVVSLQFHKRAKDVLVLVGVLIAEQYMLGFLIHAWLLQVLQSRSGIFLSAGNMLSVTQDQRKMKWIEK